MRAFYVLIEVNVNLAVIETAIELKRLLRIVYR